MRPNKCIPTVANLVVDTQHDVQMTLLLKTINATVYARHNPHISLNFIQVPWYPQNNTRKTKTLEVLINPPHVVLPNRTRTTQSLRLIITHQALKLKLLGITDLHAIRWAMTTHSR